MSLPGNFRIPADTQRDCTVRFAADEEFIGLARDAAEKGRVPDEIKRAHSPGAPGTFRV
jgi:hypothetical protein